MTKILKKIKHFFKRNNKPIEIKYPVCVHLSDADRALIFGYPDFFVEHGGHIYDAP